MSCEFVFELRRLSKLSAEAVQNIDRFDPLKEYMHITRNTETDFRSLLSKISGVHHMLNAFDKLNQTIEIMVQIVQSESLTSAFKDLFLTRKDRLQELELKIIHNFLKKALLDNSLLPKALVMKYILTTLRKNKKRAKEEYQRIYGVYLLSVLFVVFENKKSKDALLTVLKSNDLEWYQDAVKQINSYFSPDKITDTRLQAQFKLGMNEEEDNYKFRCKSLATIYNFFVVDDEKVLSRQDIYRIYVDLLQMMIRIQ